MRQLRYVVNRYGEDNNKLDILVCTQNRDGELGYHIRHTDTDELLSVLNDKPLLRVENLRYTRDVNRKTGEVYGDIQLKTCKDRELCDYTCVAITGNRIKSSKDSFSDCIFTVVKKPDNGKNNISVIEMDTEEFMEFTREHGMNNFYLCTSKSKEIIRRQPDHMVFNIR